MNKKKLIIVTISNWAKLYIEESIWPLKIKKFDLITDKKNNELMKFIRENNIDCNLHIRGNLTSDWLKKKI